MKNFYNELLMDRLIHIITLSCQTSELCQYFLFIIINANLMSTYTTHIKFLSFIRIIDFLLDSKVRLVTLELTIKLLIQLTVSEGQCLLRESHLAIIEAAKEQSTSLLKNFYKVCELLKLKYTCVNFLCLLSYKCILKIY